MRLAIVVEAELRDQLLGERTPRALGDQCIFAAKLDAPRKTALEASVAGDSHVARGDAHRRAGFAIKDLDAREAGKDIDAQGLRFRPQKAHDIAKRANEIAMIIHQARHDEIGQPQRSRGAEHIEPVGAHLRLQRPVLILAPIGEEFVESTRIDDRAGQNMGAEFGAFFDDHDRNFRRKLLEADRGGKTSGAGAGDHHIEIHGFAWRQSDFCLEHRGFRSLWARNSVAK